MCFGRNFESKILWIRSELFNPSIQYFEDREKVLTKLYSVDFERTRQVLTFHDKINTRDLT